MILLESGEVMGRRKLGLVFGVWAFVFLVATFGVVLNVRSVKSSSETIYIRADGSIDPPTAPISTLDNMIYTLTDNITSSGDGIIVEKNNVIVDGDGYTLQGTFTSKGIDLTERNNVTIKNINVRDFHYGINLYSVTNCTVTGNNITNNSQFGVKFRISSNCTISNNDIMNNTYVGVWLFSSSKFTISGNAITDHFYGIYLYPAGASNNTLCQNNIMNNSYGVRLVNRADNNIIWGNNLTNNDQAISFSSSPNNTIYANTIANNNYGVGLMTSSNNTFHHNAFLNNTIQVYVSNSANYWDQGYPLGGNFWSDYTGIDGKVCPNQDVPGSDGIGDTPYVIDANSQDRYPLMKPWTPTTSPAIYISVPYHSQIKSYYCGPAALEMVFDFYGPDIPQTEIADVARTAPGGTYTCDMIRAAQFSNLSTSVGREMQQKNITGYTARKLGYASFERGGMTIDDLKSLVLAGYPIIVLTTWHFRVVVGYDSNHIIFQDSLHGPMHKMTYSDFNTDWDYSGHWGLFVSPWKVDVSIPNNVSLGSVFNVTTSITYPFPPLFQDEYPASMVNATITLSAGLNLVSGENAEKTIDTGDLVPGASANVTWTLRARSLGIYAISVEAEGKVTGFAPPIPSYPDSYSYEDRIGGSGQSVVTVIQSSDNTPPITLDDCDDKWHTTDFTITLTATDDMSDVAETYYKINDDPIQNVSAHGQPLITTEGANNTLEYWSVDYADNEEIHHILTGIKLDKTPPTIGIPSREPAGDVQPYQSVKVSVNITDSISQVKNVTLYYTLNNGTSWEEPVPMNYSLLTNFYEAIIPGQQPNTWVRYKIIAYDLAGNNETLAETSPYCTYQVIPEFPSFTVTLILMAAIVLTVAIYKRKQLRKGLRNY
jgi:parallel beta-helix repeat protein